ncbi:hypothetical protein FBEOM_3840 [Fusarium beomiforme]|uniref:Uncharacterized protein n=1 Tax=Fusarium beomiforme TaxID=44412 RepID=A0A9P5ANU7_9HYPO|nr:hypothetical protein FBEOM_3840 [Fusarium beomiforme]
MEFILAEFILAEVFLLKLILQDATLLKLLLLFILLPQRLLPHPQGVAERELGQIRRKIASLPRKGQEKELQLHADNLNKSGNPFQASDPTPTPIKRSQRSRKRKANIDNDIDEEEEEDTEDAPTKPPPKLPKRPLESGRKFGPKKSKDNEDGANDDDTDDEKRALVYYSRKDVETALEGTICEFCAKDPEGQKRFAAKPICDWKQIKNYGPEVYRVECSHCADYRSQTKNSATIASEHDHMCRVQGPKHLLDFKYKKYGIDDPHSDPYESCGACINRNWQAICDVDTILGYHCSYCRKHGSCRVGGGVIPLKRPNKLKDRPWFRHPCDRCLLLHKTPGPTRADDGCSWVNDRREWENGQACTRCQQDGTPCLDLGTLVTPQTRQVLPSTWNIRPKFELDEREKKKETVKNKERFKKAIWHEYAEVTTRSTPWRKMCEACQDAKGPVYCLVMWKQPDHACERCTQFGIDCVVKGGDGRRKYPIYDLSRVGFGQFTPFLIKPDRPGALYYLALGYGQSGINDIKDGRQVEHWVGPVAPVYGLSDMKDGPEHYRRIADFHRTLRPPANVVPPNGLSGLLQDRSVKDITGHDLGNLIAQSWENPRVPKDMHAYRITWSNLCHTQDRRMAQAGIEIHLAAAPKTARVFEGAPVLIDIERIQDPTGVEFGPQIPYAQQIQSNQVPMVQPVYGNTGQPTLYAQPQQQPIQQSQFQGAQPDHEDLFQQMLYIQSQQQQIQKTQFLAGQSQYENTGPVLDTQPEQAQQVQQNQILAGEPEYEYNGYGEQPFFNGDDTNLPLLEVNDVDDGQQAPPTGLQTQGKPPNLSPTIQGILKLADKEGLRTYNRSRVHQGERWRNTKTFDVNAKPLRQRMPSGIRVPKSASIKTAFNPFLGFTLGPDQKPCFKEKTKSSRWKVFNPLEGIDMDEWHQAKSEEPRNKFQTRLFSVINGQTDQHVPSRDVLSDVPCKQRGERTERYCAEPGEGGIGYCGSWNTNERDQATCQSLAHRNTTPGYFPVCNDCTQSSVKDLFNHGHAPITESELLSMRAYLCNDCAGHMSSSSQNAAQYRTFGAQRIYGIAADREHYRSISNPNNDPPKAVKFISNSEAPTGCSCANRMLGTALCRFHRLYYAEEALKQSALMQEWRLSRFKKAVCPSCLAQKPLEEVNLSANISGFVTGVPAAWACLNCNDWVANEQNGENNQPKIIDKPVWNLNIGRELLIPRHGMALGRVHEEEDVKMIDD